MKDFDRLVKEIVESEEPRFRNKYWKQFAQQTGIRYAPSVLKSLLFVAGIVLLVGSIGFIALLKSDKNRQPKNNETIEQKIDTTFQKQTEEKIFKEEVNSNKPSKIKCTTSKITQTPNEIPTPIQEQIRPIQNSESYWRGADPMRTDTIKDDD